MGWRRFTTGPLLSSTPQPYATFAEQTSNAASRTCCGFASCATNELSEPRTQYVAFGPQQAIFAAAAAVHELE
jgi:hypothetical protein